FALRLPDLRPLVGAARCWRHALRDGGGPGAVVVGDGVALLARVALRVGPVLGVGLRQPVRDLAVADGAGAVSSGALAVGTGHRSRRRGSVTAAARSSAASPCGLLRGCAAPDSAAPLRCGFRKLLSVGSCGEGSASCQAW